MRLHTLRLCVFLGLFVLMTCPAWADQTFNGTLFYTNFTGGQNVNSVNYSYDQTTHAFSLSSVTNIASAPGADGIIFDSHGNLLVGGQGSNQVFQYTTGGTLVSSASSNTNSFHLALDPSGNAVYTSTFEGPLEKLSLTPGLNPAAQATVVTSPTGGLGGVTQLAFLGGQAYYDDSNPNCCGSFGTIDLSTFGSGTVTTTQLGSGTAVHGMIVDPFTDLLTFFGAGFTATYDPLTNTYVQSPGQFSCDFDQGATDGFGHALVAGCGAITLIDYSGSHDITHPNFVTSMGGFGGIDDVAPLSGVGSNTTPEPATLTLFGVGGAFLLGRLRRKLHQ